MDKLNFDDINDLKKFLKENLLTKNEAAAITGQTPGAFNNAVHSGMINPFFESSGVGSAKAKLYLKSDVEHYRDTKRNINKP